MSDLSVALHKIGAFFATAVAKLSPAEAATVNAASQQVTNAAGAIQDVLPILAKIGADAALTAMGATAAQDIPWVNDFIDALVIELDSRKTATAAS